MKMVKQVIVVRKDLNMRKGKMISQGCHASMKIFFDRMTKYYTLPNSWGPEEKDFTGIHYELRNATPEMEEWIDGIFTKIVLGVDSLEELLTIKNNAEKAGLPVALIEDNGLTEFGGVKTITCIAIGPANSEQIDLVTGGLKLL